MRGAGRKPKNLEFTPEINGRRIFGGRQCPKCEMRKFSLTGRWRLVTTKSGGRTLRRVQVKCLACGYEWWSQSPRVLRLSAR